ncbi:MAG TPA: EpsI family protein [Terracidiphilus sp.]|nr:EpsI family protein [Terracidiphilus sp.]
MKGLRYISVIVLLVATVLMLRVHGDADVIPSSEPLSLFPHAIEGYTGRDITIDQATLDVLGNGDFLSRIYTRPASVLPIGLFIAYFPSQRTGSTIHSPKHCLPGAGWYFDSSKYVELTDDSGKTHKVGEYVVSNGDQKQFVIYWYQAHGRSVASEYMAKFYLVEDAMRMDRTDGSLIRVMSPIDPLQGTPAARARVEAFTKRLMPVLPRFIPN